MQAHELESFLGALLQQNAQSLWLSTIVAAVLAGVGAFIGAYLRKRGENRAMQENFTAIRQQLKITTQDTEEIKQQLFGHAWRTRQQWSAREQYYTKLLDHLYRLRLAYGDLDDYFIEPGSEHMPDAQLGEIFSRLRSEAGSTYGELRKLVGPATIFLSPTTTAAVDALFVAHWNLANFDAICSADYFANAHKLVAHAYDQVLTEARTHLGVDNDA